MGKTVPCQHHQEGWRVHDLLIDDPPKPFQMLRGSVHVPLPQFDLNGCPAAVLQGDDRIRFKPGFILVVENVLKGLW